MHWLAEQYRDALRVIVLQPFSRKVPRSARILAVVLVSLSIRFASVFYMPAYPRSDSLHGLRQSLHLSYSQQVSPALPSRNGWAMAQ
jgi:hypothetical protein